MTPAGDTALDAFFDRLSRAGRGLLLLDYDGTLAPFHVDRYRAFPHPDVHDALEPVAADPRTRLVVITGRPAREILQLLQLPVDYEIWGCHGREHRLVDGTTTIHGVTDEHEAMLELAHGLALDVAGRDRVETKVGCIAVHWRPLSLEQRDALRQSMEAVWKPLARNAELDIHLFDGGIELCTPGRSKGDAINALLAEHDTGSPPVAFLGDDWTDEFGFQALGDRGLSILVRNEPRETAAHARITLPEGIAGFLRRWHAALSQSEVPAP